MLPRQATLPHPANRANSFAPTLLLPLGSLFPICVVRFQQLAASFCKTPGVGLPIQCLVRCNEAQKSRSVTPLLATLTHSLSRKSVPCHSYENTRHGVPLRSRHPLLTAHYSRFVAPLFSYSYKPLFPQLLCLHIYTKPPAGGVNYD